MNWDWWYGNKLFTVGVPIVTTALSVRFLVLGQIAAGLCLLALVLAELTNWFYRWIEWREPEPRTRIQEGLLAGANTSPAFRR